MYKVNVSVYLSALGFDVNLCGNNYRIFKY